MAQLVLVRHGESEWNAQGLWTGLTDIPLSQKGIEEAREAGELIKDIPITIAFTSSLKRAQQTLSEILKVLGKQNIPTTQDKALNERDYGDYTGKNKWKIKEELGEEEFNKLRRSWDYPIPNGESLKDVYSRVVPYYEQNILPHLSHEENVIISAHGNSLRSLVKHIESIPDDKISEVEILTGQVYVYSLGNKGTIISKEIRGRTV